MFTNGSKGTEEGDLAYRKHVAEALSANSVEISALWLHKLKDVVPESTRDIFPSELYLDHVPSMIEQIGSILGDSDAELAMHNSIITRKAMELGELRFEQDASVNQLLREYDILALILEQFIVDQTEDWQGEPLSSAAGVRVLSTISRVLHGILRATTDTFVEKYLSQIKRTTENLTSFNGFVSHELRSPLQAALLNVDLLMESHDLRDDDRQGLMATRTSIEQAASMLSNLQTLVHRSDAENKEAALTSQRVDISAMVRDIASQLKESMDMRSVTLQVEDDIGSIHIETAKLKLILSNLLSNAIKYSDPEDPNSRVCIRRSDQSTAEQGVFIIEDNGLGIDESMQSRIFDLRVRAHEDQDDELDIDGHGIGLHLVAEAVKDIDGSIELESTPGKGTIITLVILSKGPLLIDR